MHNAQVLTRGEAAATGPGRPVTLAPLKDDLPPEKRALAEDLRKVFLQLGVSVRRYAARRHLDASSVTRYLSGRVPPWDFVAGVIADVQEAQVPLTPQAEKALRDLHRAAQKSNRRSSEVQELQDRLAEADEETRRITTRQRALEEALLDREGRLARVRGECRNLESRIDEQGLTHRAEVNLWQGVYAELEEECGDLQEQVLYLQEALAVTRAELIAAEDRCHRLESRLETLQELGDSRPEDDAAPSIVALLEEADRRSSVPELVRAVGDLELRTRKAIASELVRSASQSRTVEEVAGLLAGLRQAGFDAHAQTALPAMVMTRSVDDTSALARELIREDLEDYVLILVQASVKFHQPEDVAAFATALHRVDLPQHAEGLLGAAAVVRPVADLVSVAHHLSAGEHGDAAVTAMTAAAAHRPVGDLVTLSIALRDACMEPVADALQRAAAERRPASHVAEFIRALSLHGLEQDAEAVFTRTQVRSVGYLTSFVLALEGWQARSVLWDAAASRPGDDLAVLISEFHLAGRAQFAASLLVRAVCTRDAGSVRELMTALVPMAPGAESVLRSASRSLPPAEAALLLVRLENYGLTGHADTVFQSTVHDELVGHAGHFITALAEAGSRYARQDALARYAGEMVVSTLAPLMLALDSASLGDHLDTIIRGSCLQCPVLDLRLLAKRLEAESSYGQRVERVERRVEYHVVRERSLDDLAALVGVLRSAGLTSQATRLTDEASAVHGRAFKERLAREETKHEQKVMSRSFWLSDRPRRRGKHA
ncbi:ATP/GTP-binding protein [Streptomyces sp. NPDC020951]|uniref:ATP/GTP-binding protein n=1 Tax=Streptomyces sp. NPDC020951 TaxID=3365104 RepID=UPI0037B43F89